MQGTSAAPPGPSEAHIKPHVFVRECDLVMKGGITSGVVYPLAIVEIAKAFRLRSIGGTSAGAIAAAAAAAAEVGRQRREARLLDEAHEDFAALGLLPQHLAATGASAKSKLEAFFQASIPLCKVFKLLKSILGKSGTAAVCCLWFSLLRHFWLAALLGGLIGSMAVWFTPWHALHVAWLCTALILGLIGATVLACSHAIWIVIRNLPANGFGICTGMPNGREVDNEALTVWLADFYNKISGQDDLSKKHSPYLYRNKPLTFGDLKEYQIDLQVMTTCLTMGRPFRLPFRQDEIVKENNQFYFRPDEFRKLFPAKIVNWMCEHQRSLTDQEDLDKFLKLDMKGFCRLPDPCDLPVIVAVRMSLSFPVLLSAIPLYSIDFRGDAEQDEPQRCWFTDGGVGSNFPIHFFDALIPSRPTFGLDLGIAMNESEPRVYMPMSNKGGIQATRHVLATAGFGSIASFLGALVSVAKDWNHEALSHLPGYRDRIAVVRLTDKEGGLNLNMPAERIMQLARYGKTAGQEFVRRFGDPQVIAPKPPEDTMNWENHQRIRLRLLIASMAETLEHMLSAHESMEKEGMSYERFFSAGIDDRGAYPWAGRSRATERDAMGLPVSQAGLGMLIYKHLLEIARINRASITTQPKPDGTTSGIDPMKNSPRPVPEVKLRPRI